MITTIAVALFALAAVGGVTLAVMRLKDMDLPLPLAFGHGALAAGGLVCLIIAVVTGGVGGLAKLSLVLFIVAALGGFFLIATHLRRRMLPIPVVVFHGAAAVLSFILLLVALYAK